MKTLHLMRGSALVLSLALLSGCDKKKPNTVPEPDTELQSSIDASYSTFVISDIDMITGFVGENNLSPRFYVPSPESVQTQSSGTITVSRPPNQQTLYTGFRDTKCFDGRLRSGSISVDYTNIIPDAIYYHSYGFKGAVALLDYRVDNWLVKTANGTSALVTNKLGSPAFDPNTTKLSWSIEGSFELIDVNDPSRKMTWSGKLLKTLANTSDRNVFNPSRLIQIDWTKAVVEYSGEFTGTTTSGETFSMRIPADHPLTRDFSCFPETVGGLDASNNNRVWYKEFHPFTSGIAYLKSGDRYQREIFYGSEGSVNADRFCDNAGEVVIKGISYKVDFMQ